MIRSTFLAAAAVALLAGCASSTDDAAQEQGYANDGDTGAAAPATRTNVTPMQPPDSTTGVASPTGRPGAAGVPQAQDANIAEPIGKNPQP
jgi:uncharacterized lipoprotein